MGFNLDTRLRDIYRHPVGHDIIHKILLQIGLGDGLVDNPILGGLKLRTLRRLVRKYVGDDFFETVLTLLNNAPERIQTDAAPIAHTWWKEAVFYQIYPRSFMDSDGDGVGDIRGIASKLDYLRELGVDAIWLCPVYDSPNDDNGYDIRDYRKIADEYGGMPAFEALLSGVHERGMRLIMDLVVNHTSDEHAWFQAARSDRTSPYRQYYYFREKPNNWTSFFSGPAWKYDEAAQAWALHLFSQKQMDLNWDHEPLRQDIYAMIRWWLERGVDGFRLDVINYISKTPGLPDGNAFVGKLMGYTGIEHYFYGPNLHKYLAEMRREAFEPYDAFSIGETPGVGLEMSQLLTADYRSELDMAFAFDILETPGKERFDQYVYDPVYLKSYFTEWMENYSPHCWMAIFYNNHDNPRMISKIDPSGRYRTELAKLLALIQFTLRGTPFIYQGDELGAANEPFRSMEELRDVESLNLYSELIKVMSPEEAFRKVLSGTRDHARTPMRWNAGLNAGFSTAKPWIGVTPSGYNAEAEQADAASVWHFYKSLIELRKASPALIYGSFEPVKKCSGRVFAYARKLGDQSFLVVANLSDKASPRPDTRALKLRLSNYATEAFSLRPYEALIFGGKS
jgi:oligo-1,6-glucosidase